MTIRVTVTDPAGFVPTYYVDYTSDWTAETALAKTYVPAGCVATVTEVAA